MPGQLVRRRGAFVAVLLIVGVLGGPGSAAAGQLIRSVDNSTSLDCTADGAGGAAVFSIGRSESFGDFASVSIFPSPADPASDPPTYVEDGSQAPTITLSGDVLDATVPMVRILDPDTFTTEPAAPATVHAVLANDGPPSSVADSFQNGNSKVRVTGSVQPITATGALNQPETDTGSFTTTSCSGQTNMIVTTETNPDTRIASLGYIATTCVLSDLNGSGGTLDIRARLFGVSIVYTQGGTGAQFFGSGPELTGTGMSGPVDWIDVDTDEIVGTGAVDMTLSSTGIVHKYRPTAQFYASTVTETVLEAAGTLTTFDGAEFDVAGCSFASLVVRTANHTPTGPKPGGAAPLNDLPEHAAGLPVGKTRISTRGAAQTPEAACIDPVSGFDTPLGRTVWYALAGTGGTVTIDTAGTAFDTVVAVYDGDVSNEVACVDDVQLGISRDAKTIQAAVTFTAQVGHTYLIQIGGFDNGDQPVGGEYGTLVIARR